MIPIITNAYVAEYLETNGYEVRRINNINFVFDLEGNELTGHDQIVTDLINSFNAVPYIQNEYKDLIKEVSAKKRLQYVTQAAGKDAEYTFKAQEAKQYDIDQSVGTFMQARINATGESAAVVAAEWNAKSVAWQSIGASIAAIEDKASQDISAETDKQLMQQIANTAIEQIEAI